MEEVSIVSLISLRDFSRLKALSLPGFEITHPMCAVLHDMSSMTETETVCVWDRERFNII